MKKITLLLLALCLNSFAAYFDVGLGVGTSGTKSDDVNVEEVCSGCDNAAVDLGFRLGGQLTSRVWLAADLSIMGNRYQGNDGFLQFNSEFIGPSLIVYPTEHLQLSGSFGYAHTRSITDMDDLKLRDGEGVGLGLTASYDTNKKHGALIGAKIFTTSVALDGSEDLTVNAGVMLFVRYVYK